MLKHKRASATLKLDPAHEERNPGCPLDLGWIATLGVNRSAVERRAASLPARRSVKQQWQAAWLLQAVRCIDPVSYTHLDVYKRQHMAFI